MSRPSEYDYAQEALPLVTIITVVRNGEDYLQETMNSVFDQDYKNIEYLVLDGNSDDGTIEIIKKNEQHISHWQSEPDSGIYNAMNKGIQLSNGLYIGFLNASDLLYPDAVSRLAFAHKELFFQYTLGPIHIKNPALNQTSTLKPKKDFTSQSYENIEMPAGHLSIFVRADFIKSLEMFDEQFQLSADLDLMIRAIKKSTDIWYFQDPVGSFKLGGVSGSYGTAIENFYVMKKNKIPFIVCLYLVAKSFIRISSRFFIPARILQHIPFTSKD